MIGTIPFLGHTNLKYTIPYFKSTQTNWSLFCDIEFVENSDEFNIATLKCIIDVENWFSMYFDPINQSLLLYFESGSQYNVPMKFRANENFRIVVSYNTKELLIYTSVAQKKFKLSKPLISKERTTTHFVSNRDKTSYLDGVFLKRIFMVPKAYNHKECINLITSKVSTNPLERMDFREKLDIISKII